MESHVCTQQKQIVELVKSDKRQTEAIFGNQEIGEIGIVGELKAIRALLEEMKPTYIEIKGWGDFYKRGKEVGGGLVLFLTGLGVIAGSIYAFKEWIKK